MFQQAGYYFMGGIVLCSYNSLSMYLLGFIFFLNKTRPKLLLRVES